MEELLQIEKARLFFSLLLVICILVISAIMLDLWDGVHTAKITNQRIHSHKLRVTISKISEYFRFIMIGFLVDCLGFFFDFYLLPFVALLFGAGLIAVEAKSMFEHANRRKSHTTELPTIIKSIMDCVSEKDAKKIIEHLTNAAAEQSTTIN